MKSLLVKIFSNLLKFLSHAESFFILYPSKISNNYSVSVRKCSIKCPFLIRFQYGVEIKKGLGYID